MNLSMTEKILREHLVKGRLQPGEENEFRMDHVLMQDATGTMAIMQFEASDAFDQGMRAFQNKDYNLAIKCLTEAIRLKPDYAYAYYNRSVVNTAKGDLGKAIAERRSSSVAPAAPGAKPAIRQAAAGCGAGVMAPALRCSGH